MTLRITLGPVNHLATGDVALCGADIRDRKTVALTAGSDFLTHPADCKACAFVWRDMAREVRR